MVVDREETQAKLAKLSAATLAHTPGQTYTLADRFEERARSVPERVFLVYGERTLRYAEFNARANRVAHVGRDVGLSRGDCVALMMENNSDEPRVGLRPTLSHATTTLRFLRHPAPPIRSARPA